MSFMLATAGCGPRPALREPPRWQDASRSGQVYVVQIDLYDTQAAAEADAARLRTVSDIPVSIVYRAPFFRLRVGSFTNREDAEKEVRRFREMGFSQTRWVYEYQTNGE